MRSRAAMFTRRRSGVFTSRAVRRSRFISMSLPLALSARSLSGGLYSYRRVVDRWREGGSLALYLAKLHAMALLLHTYVEGTPCAQLVSFNGRVTFVWVRLLGYSCVSLCMLCVYVHVCLYVYVVYGGVLRHDGLFIL